VKKNSSIHVGQRHRINLVKDKIQGSNSNTTEGGNTSAGQLVCAA
jgi:hypothetical protein